MKEIPDTSNIKQISSEKAKRDLIQSFGKSGEILNEIEIPELPSIIEFSVSRLSGLTDKEMEKLDSMPGVVEVVTGFETREQIHTFFSITEFVGIFLISLLIMSIISIIHNSIQISIRMRIEEIEILKILGAKPGFIRLPYLIEGIFIAFCGALAAIGFIYFLYQFVLAGITFNESTYGIREITQFFSIIQIGGFLILISILGFLSSLLATNKIINELTV
ncbi:FtsX-like permease family protein [bacterium]|nr:FtsX-like permease family protein [bacterium]